MGVGDDDLFSARSVDGLDGVNVEVETKDVLVAVDAKSHRAFGIRAAAWAANDGPNDEYAQKENALARVTNRH